MLMCYSNLIYARGLERFADSLVEVGASGLIVPDLPFEEAPAVLAACDALVSPTRYEAYGLAVHEALARGLPALVSRSAGIADEGRLSAGQLSHVLGPRLNAVGRMDEAAWGVRLLLTDDDTPKLSDLDLDGFDAVMVAGGLAPMFTFRDNE